MTLLKLYEILQEVGIPVWHYEAKQEKIPYIIYQEQTTTGKWASGQIFLEVVNVEVVHFMKKEFDPSLERLKKKLLKNKIGYTIAHGFDEETKNIINHFSIAIDRDMEVDHD